MSAAKDSTLYQPQGVTMLQTMSLEQLFKGGFTHTMTAAELIDLCKAEHGIAQDKPIRVIGVGGTKGLGDEITYMGGSLYKISADSGRITTTLLDLQTQISFSQIALAEKDGVTQTISLPEVKAPAPETDAVQMNHGGAFKEIENLLFGLLGPLASAVVQIKAKTHYIKTRAVCPIVEETGTKLEPTASLLTMLGGKVVMVGGYPAVDVQKSQLNEEASQQRLISALKVSKRDSMLSIGTVKTQVIESSYTPESNEPQNISMVGILTGTAIEENQKLKGLHLHCDKGHVLDLGALQNVNITITPISTVKILSDEKSDKVWRTAVTKETAHRHP